MSPSSLFLRAYGWTVRRRNGLRKSSRDGTVEDLADLAREDLGGERFRKERGARREDALLGHRGVGVTRHVEDLHTRPMLREDARELASVHPGHDDVAQQHLDRRILALREADGLGRTRGREDAISLEAQELLDEPADFRLVLDEEDRLRARCSLANGRPLG